MQDKEKKLLNQLGILMSGISEDCYCAGWLYGTEYFVPELCKRAIETNIDQPWGHGRVSPDIAKELVEISEKLGSWVDVNEKGSGYIVFNPFPIPTEYKVTLDEKLKDVQENNT